MAALRQLEALRARAKHCAECHCLEGLHHGTCSRGPGAGFAPCPSCQYVLTHAADCGRPKRLR
jgi:hypothetical protein